MKSPAFFTAAIAIGDCISATPTIRKLSQTYNRKVVVFSNHPDIFSRLPYVERSEDIKEFSSFEREAELRHEFDLHYSFWKMGQKVVFSDDRGIEMKHAIIDIRQYHAIDNGFTLLPPEMHCDFVPDQEDKMPYLPEKFICLHPFKNWPSRTWDFERWKNLLEKLRALKIPVVIVGKDLIDENLFSYLNEIQNANNRVLQEIQEKKTLDILPSDSNEVINLTNKTSLSQVWQIINKSAMVITMDSGILHLAGTTDTHIIQLGSNINPLFRAPYRKGRQDYKYDYVLGSCKIFCASDMKYSLRDWEFGCDKGTPLQCVSLIDTCLENKSSFECHPTVNQVLSIIENIWETSSHTKVFETPITEQEEISNILVKIESKSLGDQIGAMSTISKFSKGKNVYVICGLDNGIFSKSYPDLRFLPYNTDPIINTHSGNWNVTNLEVNFSEYKILEYKFDKPLLEGYADQLGIVNWERPRIDLHLGARPIKAKYICFSMHSTTQAKHWNYPGGWEILCKMLRKEGITPVCIDRFPGFGTEGWWNEVPSSCVKKQGLNLQEMTNYIHHSEFFIGVSSGLSWVAHALGKQVVMVSGVTSEKNEFTQDITKIIDKSVCHGCINQKADWFDPSDWLWCPLHRNTERQFECTKVITPDHVFSQIKNSVLNLYTA